MKKIFLVLGCLLFLVGCGVPAKETGSDGTDSSSGAVPIIPLAYADFTGKLYNASNVLLFGRNRKVDAAHQDRIYEWEDMDGPYRSIFTWYTDGQIKEEYYNWNTTINAYTFTGTIYHSYELNSYGLLSKKILRLPDGSIDKIENYNYPGYVGSGNVMVIDVVAVYYLGGVAGATINEQIIFERSSDNLNVTENYYTEGVLKEMYVYVVSYL